MRLSLPVKILPPYLNIVQAQQRHSNMLLLGVQEAVDKTAERLVHVRATNRPATGHVILTDQQLDGYIYTDVLHPKTKEPLFFSHVIPYFGFASEQELNSQIKLTDQDGVPVPEEFYTLRVGEDIYLYTNLFSDDSNVYFVQINQYPNSERGIRKTVLLDSRIRPEQFFKPEGTHYQLGIGYRERYVPDQLDLDNEWPLLRWSTHQTLLSCKVHAMRMEGQLYRVPKLYYLECYSDREILSVSSHGYQLINSTDPVVELFCTYLQYGMVVYPDVRGNSYEQHFEPFRGDADANVL